MAYPVVSAVYGLKPVSLTGGRVFAGSTRMVPISSGYGYNFFNGDVVQLSGGTLAVTTLGAATSPVNGTIGVFVGCEYTNSSGQIIRSQYWPASTVSNYAVAYIVDDPQVVFKAAFQTQSTSSVSNTPGTAVGYISEAFVGTNALLITNGSNGGSASGNTTTGDSGMGLTGTFLAGGTTQGNTRTTGGGAFRIIQTVTDTQVVVQATGSSSSSTITLSSANSAIQPGMQVICTASGATNSAQGNYNYVTQVSGTSVTVANAIGTTASGSTYSFVGFPEALVQWNFGYHSYFNATGV